jgi:hypothetical protein
MRQGVGPRLTAKLNRPRRQNRGPCLRGNEFRRLLGDDIGIEQHIDLMTTSPMRPPQPRPVSATLPAVRPRG